MPKTHMDDPEDWKFKRNRHGDDHANNCTDGYINPKGKDPNWLQIHHILCVKACSDSTLPKDITEDQFTFVKDCFAITVWDINGGPNNIGLPCKPAYVEDPTGATGWDNHPCHQVDHDLYLKAVENYVTEQIWMELLKAQDAKKCEKITGENIAHYFNDGSTHWKGMLQTRGRAFGGTKACLGYCLTGTVPPLLVGNESKWYVPFSMAPTKDDARERVKPPAGRTLALSRLLDAIN